MSRKTPILGVHAPPPRFTGWAALALACGLSLVFLAGLGLVEGLAWMAWLAGAR